MSPAIPPDRRAARIASLEQQLEALEDDLSMRQDSLLAGRVRGLRAAWQALRDLLDELQPQPPYRELPTWHEEDTLEDDKGAQVRRILVVDDNREVADALAMLLRVMGHQVMVARSGEKALELALGFNPQLVFLDIGLPGIDGYEVARQLRGMPHQEPLTLVALTGHGRPDDRQRALEAGFDHFLLKPADLDKLEALVNAAP